LLLLLFICDLEAEITLAFNPAICYKHVVINGEVGSHVCPLGLLLNCRIDLGSSHAVSPGITLVLALSYLSYILRKVFSRPFKRILEIVTGSNGFEGLPEHLVVGPLLAVELLHVTKHDGELSLHVDTQFVGVPSLNTALYLHSGDYIVAQDRQVSVPGQLAMIEVHQDVKQTLYVVFGP